MILEDLSLEKFEPENYRIYVKNEDGRYLIYENEYGIYIEKEDEKITLSEGIHINIPDFSEYEDGDILKILFNEVMVNITKDGPKPNFIAYENAWYRDAGIIGMVLKETDNIEQIRQWIENIDKMYDEQNGEKELDNLGQVLYLQSLIENRNKELIERVIEEARSLKNSKGYIEGITDTEPHAIYQTKWLKFGLESLGLDSSEYIVPDIEDSYEELMWFYKDNKEYNFSNKPISNFPYIYYAYMHFHDVYVDVSKNYPISYELSPNEAIFQNLEIIDKEHKEKRLVVPHAWAASEAFLYLLERD